MKDLEYNGMEGKFQDILNEGMRIKKYFESYAEETGQTETLPILICVSEMWKEIIEFNKSCIPLIKLLGNEAIEDEHWIEIKNITSVDVNAKVAETDASGIFLKHVLGIDIDKYMIELEDISAKAFKQHKIKKDIDKMKQSLKEKELTIESYKDNQFYIIKEIDAVTQDLDDKIQNLQAIKNYPDLNDKLRIESTNLCIKIERFARTIELWVKFQKNWL